MKERSVKTRFWRDTTIRSLSKDAHYLFLYLITNEYIGISGYVELSNETISFESKITPEELLVAETELSTFRRAFFKDGWIFVTNARKHLHYGYTPINTKVAEKEYENVPPWFKEHLRVYYGYTMGIDDNQEPITNKPSPINKKQEPNVEPIQQEEPTVIQLMSDKETTEMVDWLDKGIPEE